MIPAPTHHHPPLPCLSFLLGNKEATLLPRKHLIDFPDVGSLQTFSLGCGQKNDPHHWLHPDTDILLAWMILSGGRCGSLLLWLPSHLEGKKPVLLRRKPHLMFRWRGHWLSDGKGILPLLHWMLCRWSDLVAATLQRALGDWCTSTRIDTWTCRPQADGDEMLRGSHSSRPPPAEPCDHRPSPFCSCHPKTPRLGRHARRSRLSWWERNSTNLPVISKTSELMARGPSPVLGSAW